MDGSTCIDGLGASQGKAGRSDDLFRFVDVNALEKEIFKLKKPYATDDPRKYGVKLHSQEVAFRKKYVQLNHPEGPRKFLIFDIDQPDAFSWWKTNQLPAPTYIVINPASGHGHYIYELSTPVNFGPGGSEMAQEFFQRVNLTLRNKLKADQGYTGVLVQNPCHPYWDTYYSGTQYDLGSLAAAISPLVKLPKWGNTPPPELDQSCRNTSLFHAGRVYAYSIANKYDSVDFFQQDLKKYLRRKNEEFKDGKGLLPESELDWIVKSISKWVWEKYQGDGTGDDRNRGRLKQDPIAANGWVDPVLYEQEKKQRQSIGCHLSNLLRPINKLESILRTLKEKKVKGTPSKSKVAKITEANFRTVSKFWPVILPFIKKDRKTTYKTLVEYTEGLLGPKVSNLDLEMQKTIRDAIYEVIEHLHNSVIRISQRPRKSSGGKAGSKVPASSRSTGKRKSKGVAGSSQNGKGRSSNKRKRKSSKREVTSFPVPPHLLKLARDMESRGLLLDIPNFQKACAENPEKFRSAKNIPSRAENGVIRSSYQTVTGTGRLTTGDGKNLQGMAKELRRHFSSRRAGCVMVSVDISQADPRLLAHFSGDAALCKVLSDPNGDYHQATADALGVDRKVGKVLNNGLPYGISWMRIMKEVGCSDRRALWFLDEYKRKFPHVDDFIQNQKDLAGKGGYVQTITGRQVEASRNNAVACAIQGSVADIVNEASRRINEDAMLRQLGAELLLVIHDEVVLDVPRDNAEAALQRAREILESVMSLKVPLFTSGGIGKSWGDLK